MKIRNVYTDKNKFYNIRNINFDSIEDFSQNSGKYICQSIHNDGVWFDSDFDLENGVYLFETTYDKTKALRVYKDTMGVCENYKYRIYNDHKIVSELISRQKFIKLTDMPTGIVTIENYVVGQEIPFYYNFNNLTEIIYLKTYKEIIEYYIKIIDILEELNNNGIVYTDVHAKNFVINSCNNLLKLIDFDERFISIDNEKKFMYSQMIINIRSMINSINDIININFKIKESQTLEEIRKEIITKSKKYM